MKLKYLLAASVVSLTAAAVAPTPLAAQQITSGIEGFVTDAEGTPIEGATVVITDTRTGQTRTDVTGSDGTFRSTSLVSGGPYTITATAPGFEGQVVEDQFINISGNTQYTFELAAAAGAEENVIVVSGQRAGATQLAVGPGNAFGSETLDNFPSITRDIRDIIRIDPRVSLDRANEVDRVSCLGGNDRSNTFTVDGIVQADVFGLNGTPFAARNALPLPYDTIAETSVEFAPFDVEYTDFTGCLINVVTKSGGNEFSGSAFFTYRDSGLRGDSIDGDDFSVDPFDERRWGATLGGPIVKDRLFFFAGYEETDLGSIQDTGPIGAGFANEFDFVTQAQFDQFANIARTVYGQDVGGYPSVLPEGSTRYFGRLDAYITDGQRLEATYQRLEESNVEPDSGGNEVTGLNSYEDEGTVSDYYSVRLYSDWSDRISTELRLSRADVADVQGPVGFGEAQSENPTVRLTVLTQVPDGQGGFENGRLSTGPGIFRSANALNTNIDQGRFIFNYDGGEHQLKVGAEVNDLEVFNLFAINATGTLFFNSFDDFANGLVAPGSFSTVFSNADALADGLLGGGVINATASGDINDAAATFRRTIYSVFIQDEWQPNPQLNITAGLRVQWFDGDAPQANPEFLRRYGFTNANPFSRIDTVLLPRLAASYEFDNTGFIRNSRLTAGFGIFTGGDPVVYFSNAFSNNGFNVGQGTTFDCAPGELTRDPATGQIDVVAGGTFTGFPTCAIAAGSEQAAAGLADTQSTDPTFKVPTAQRWNLGFETDFGTDQGLFADWRLNLDAIYTRFVDPLNFVDLSQTPDIRTNNGFTVDGRPIYQAIDPTRAGCNAELQGTGGTPPVWLNVSPACFGTGRDDEIQLTNADSYDSLVLSGILSKRFDGLFTDGGRINFSLGYAWTNSNDRRNNGSSTATSSYDVTAAFDRQAPVTSTSGFETRHNISARLFWSEEFFGDYDTSIGIFFSARSGRPFSLTFDGGGVFSDGSSGNDNALLYIPTGPNDPNLSNFSFVTDPVARANAITAQTNAVNSMLDYLANSETGKACDFELGRSIDRNTCRNDWYYDLDMRISQELPFVGSLTGLNNDRIELFADFDNVLNLIDDSWNVFRSRSDFVDLVDAGFTVRDSANRNVRLPGVDSQGRYVIGGFNPDDREFIGVTSSIWRIQVGVRYEF